MRPGFFVSNNQYLPVAVYVEFLPFEHIRILLRMRISHVTRSDYNHQFRYTRSVNYLLPCIFYVGTLCSKKQGNGSIVHLKAHALGTIRPLVQQTYKHGAKYMGEHESIVQFN